MNTMKNQTQREIKFRAWDTDSKKLLLVQDAKFVDGVMIGAKGTSWDSQVVVMQYTGLKDKNGVEIYEGDVVRVPKGLHAGVYLVDWSNLKSSFVGLELDKRLTATDLWILEMGTRIEVIGNIYENPELLGEEDDE